MSFLHFKFVLLLSLCFDIIITIYFWNVNLFHAMIGLDVSPPMNDMNDVPPHNPEYCPFMLQPEQLHVIFHTIPISLPAPVHTSPPATTALLYKPTSNHPHLNAPNAQTNIILSCLTTSGTLNTHRIHTVPSVLHRHSTNPSHHSFIYLFTINNQQLNSTACSIGLKTLK